MDDSDMVTCLGSRLAAELQIASNESETRKGCRVGHEVRGRMALSLPWLAPSAEALVALTVEPMPLKYAVTDPELVLLACRFSKSHADLLSAEWFSCANVLDAASQLLTHPSASQVSFAHELGRQARQIGRVAAELAKHFSDDPKVQAACLVAPMGWLAIAATETADSISSELASSVDCKVLEQSSSQLCSVTRKLARRWQLPNWLCDILTNLHSANALIDEVCDEPAMVKLVRDLVAEAERRCGRLGIARESSSNYRHATVNLRWPKNATPPLNHVLLPHLLKTVAMAKRRAGQNVLPRLETENEILRSALDQSNQRFDAELHQAKLDSLAELAAGAGHEINNPLAVISGHAQRLSNKESDAEKKATLSTIVRQTQRIHGIIRGLMNFARPPKPHQDIVAVPVIVEDVIGELSDLKADNTTEIKVAAHDADAFVAADAAHVKTIVHHLIRNAIDAAGPNGQVNVSLECDDSQYRIVVEDSGTELSETQKEHLFDPFYSGRSAGRGRGLGLSIAWRLAKVNGGDVVYSPTADGATRFVITMPLEGQGLLRKAS